MESENASEASSAVSTPSTAELPCGAFRSEFTVSVTESPDETSGRYFIIKTIKKLDDSEYSVRRSFEDFESLHNKLSTETNTNGIIMPPMLERLSADTTQLETSSASGITGISAGCGVFRDCCFLEKYLTLAIAHPTLGRSSCLNEFLTRSEAPVLRRNPAVGLFGKLMMVTTDSRKYSHVDIDEYFQRVRDNSQEFHIRIHVTAKTFDNHIISQRKLSSRYAKLGEDILHTENSAELTSLLAKFSDVLDNIRHCIGTDAANSENTLGFQLEHQRRYSCSLRDMLNRRTQLLIDYEEANKAFDKAKPVKRSAAEETKVAAEKSLEECSEMARSELQDYNRQKLTSLKESLCTFTETKIKSARDFHGLLGKSLEYFKQVEQD